MTKVKKVYRCSSCGLTLPQWMGKCPQCGLWNTLIEDIIEDEPAVRSRDARQTKVKALSEITARESFRKSCTIEELDRVLGGGVVQGSFVLIGGDPGIGKSTLMLQMAHHLCQTGMKVLYVSGEESDFQLKMRADRLGIVSGGILVYPEVLLEKIKEAIDEITPDLIIIDSIQSVFSSQIDATPGSVSQIRHCAGVLMEIAKGKGVTVFVVGHVTKEGWIAGPKMLEHMVDTVLYFEGDDSGVFRIVRAVKNRFGTSGEIGVFEMKPDGLQEVRDPSSIFIHGLGGDIPGSAVMATFEGSRAFVVEVQALVSKTTFSMPRRITMGSDPSRLALLLAVLEKRAGVHLSQSDIVVNIAGGFKVTEPAVDLAVVMAIASSALDRPLPKGMVCIGEIGLGGELRPVSHMDSRIREALKLGFTKAAIPVVNGDCVPRIKGIELVALPHVSAALKILA
jgi:DNA repair protein RadA/Sms